MVCSTCEMGNVMRVEHVFRAPNARKGETSSHQCSSPHILKDGACRAAVITEQDCNSHLRYQWHDSPHELRGLGSSGGNT
eukprot:4077174-Amphidinium_carterae.1